MRCWGEGCAHVVSGDELRSIVGSIAEETWLSSRDAKVAIMRGMAAGRDVVPCAACGASLFEESSERGTVALACSCGAFTCTDPRCHMARVSAQTTVARCPRGGFLLPPCSASPRGEEATPTVTTHANCVARVARPPWTCATAVEWLAASAGARGEGRNATFDLVTFEALEFLVRACISGWQSALRCPACTREVEEAGAEESLRRRCVACGTQWCRSCSREACGCGTESPPSALEGKWPATLARARLRRVRALVGRGVFESFVRTCGDAFPPPRVDDVWPAEESGESASEAERHPWVVALVEALVPSGTCM